MPAKPLLHIRVHAVPGHRSRGIVQAGGAVFPCALGRSGVRADKREGDGATPLARLPLRDVWFRKDRGAPPATRLPLRVIRPDDAWCDDVEDRRYNRPIRRPPGTAEECLTRADGLYNCIVVLGWNDKPARKGKGSAIFWHIARDGFTPTAGCVAVKPDVFAKILPRLGRKAVMVITR